MDAQLQCTKDQAVHRVELRKKNMGAASARLVHVIQRSTLMPAHVKKEIENDICNFQLQLALGKAQTREAYRTQQNAIMDAIAGIEARIAHHEAELDREWEPAAREWVREETALKVELEAAWFQYETAAPERVTKLKAKKEAIANQIKVYREQVADNRRLASDKLKTFESELRAGLEQIKQAFSNLKN
jgi:predicted CoA-binding protein